MGYKFNPFTGNLDIVRAKQINGPDPASVKYNYYLATLAAHDLISAVTYHDAGLRTQRINQITYSSLIYPDSDIVKTIYYLDVGTMNQRIDKIEYVGSVFSPDSLRKVFDYSLSGIKYKLDGFNYELF